MTELLQDAGKDSAVTNPSGNERLTSITGGLLFVLLFLIGITVLRVRTLLPQHLFLGFVLIPPLGLKMFSTGWRFARYYIGDQAFRRAGPPELYLRLIAPVLVLSTVAVFVTGLELWLFGVRFGAIWLTAHKASFLIWLPFIAIHALSYLNKSTEAAAEELSGRGSPASALTRRSLVIGSLVAGVVLALASLLYASPFVFFGER
ncbi:MAG TPA: hypothetical protein VFK22_08515 [Candidatus Dormibacteraeota bacterium]|nr:hypothetical protein [Candidatus Dormibacteraeota bacterium]